LSPYFQVVKPLASERADFDNKKIRWAAESEAVPATVKAPEPPRLGVRVAAPAFRTTTKNVG
ncbi:MAG TPA: hypothetical protein VFO62_03985, partial [Candidatus Binatia bacterium]|nr:hypothetical protein [Candidatus Binatia bacterium]